MSELFIVSDIPQPLSKEETIELFNKKKSGDINARNKIIEHNIRLVFNIVIKEFNSMNFEMSEMISIGLIGLIKSVDTYDITKDVNFSVYAKKCIENEILCFIRSSNKLKNVRSLDEAVYKDDGNNITLENILYDENQDFVLNYENEEICMLIKRIVANLPERNKQIVEKYFGFNGHKPQVQREIAEYLGMSKANVSRILLDTLKQISFILKKEGVIELSVSDMQKIRLKTKKQYK